MKRLLLALLLITPLAQADLTLDPTQLDQKDFAITCEYPTQREDNEPLSVSDIDHISFYVNGALVGTNDADCSQVFDATSIANGVYSYTATTVDNEGRESKHSTPVVVTISRPLLPPKPPTGVTVMSPVL